MALISVFMPWWGADGTAFGFSGSILRWSLWSRPYVGDTSSAPALAEAAQMMGLLSLLVLAIVFITAAFVFLRSFDPNKQCLIMGFVSTIIAIGLYAGAVSCTLSVMCQGLLPAPPDLSDQHSPEELP